MPPDMYKLLLEREASSVMESTDEYKIDNRAVYIILNHIDKEVLQRGISYHLFQMARPKPC